MNSNNKPKIRDKNPQTNMQYSPGHTNTSNFGYLSNSIPKVENIPETTEEFTRPTTPQQATSRQYSRRARSGTIPSSFSPSSNIALGPPLTTDYETPQKKESELKIEDFLSTTKRLNHKYDNSSLYDSILNKHNRNYSDSKSTSFYKSGPRPRSLSTFSPWSCNESDFLTESRHKETKDIEESISIEKTLNFLGIDDDDSESNPALSVTIKTKPNLNCAKDLLRIDKISRNNSFQDTSLPHLALNRSSIATPAPGLDSKNRSRSKSFTVTSLFNNTSTGNMNGTGSGLDSLYPSRSRKLSEVIEKSSINTSEDFASDSQYIENNVFNDHNSSNIGDSLYNNVDENSSSFANKQLGLALPSRSVWVGNIDPGISTNELEIYFSPFGPIESLRLLPEKECAFINYYNTEDAIRAKEEMQGSKIGSCVVRVGFGKNDSLQNDINATHPTRALWVGNLSSQITSSQLHSIFSEFGEIESCRILSHKSCGFVNYVDLHNAIQAKSAMNYHDLHGSIVRIGYAKAPVKSSGTLSVSFSNNADNNIDSSHQKSLILKNKPSKKPKKKEEIPLHINDAPETDSLCADKLVEYNLFEDFENGRLKSFEQVNTEAFYNYVIPPLPAVFYQNLNNKPEQTRLKEIKRILESMPPSDVQQFSLIFEELVDHSVELCVDYVGNTIVQKLVEHSSDDQKKMIIKKVSPYIGSIGIHKNGTWAIQKIINSAVTKEHIMLIVESIKHLAPELLLDQFGNYVIQGCLKFGTQFNQFIYDAIHDKIVYIATGRYGSRAIRTCLEMMTYVSKQQQFMVSVSIAKHSHFLILDPNGSILVTWLLDFSNINRRYSAVAFNIIQMDSTKEKNGMLLYEICINKHSGVNLLRIINQKVENNARRDIIRRIFEYNNGAILDKLVYNRDSELAGGSASYADNLLQKIKNSCFLSDEEKLIVNDKLMQVYNNRNK